MYLGWQNKQAFKREVKMLPISCLDVNSCAANYTLLFCTSHLAKAWMMSTWADYVMCPHLKCIFLPQFIFFLAYLLVLKGAYHKNLTLFFRV